MNGISVTARKTSGVIIGTLVRGDNETTAIRIVVPRMSGGVDLAELAWAINIRNADGATDVIVVKDAKISDTSISFEWIPGGIATTVPGQTEFEIEGVGGDALVWQSGTYILRIAEDLDAKPSDTDAAALTELQQLIAYVSGELPGILEAESARVTADNERKSAENARTEAEKLRSEAEVGRAAAEMKRAEAEPARIKAEEERAVAEAVRENAENERIAAERERVTAESERVNAENGRKTAENARTLAESSRSTAESARVQNEAERIAAEAVRENAFVELKAAAEASADAASQAAQNANTAVQQLGDADAAKKAAAESATAAAESAAAAFVSEHNAAASERAASDSASAAAEMETNVEGMLESIAKEPTAQQILAVMHQELALLKQIVDEGTGGSGDLNGFSFSLGENGELVIRYANPEDETDTAIAAFATKTQAQEIAQELCSINGHLRTIAGAETAEEAEV